MTRLLSGTVAHGVRVAALVRDHGATLVTPVPASLQSMKDPLLGVVPLRSGLWLKVDFRVSLDDEGEHLRVDRSAFALVVNNDNGLSPIRVEYDRYKTSKQRSHVQISGESSSLGYAFAKTGSPPRALSKLHLPAGGSRFRPTLEDFIEFLAQEGLLADLRPGWKEVVARSRADWETRQTRAAVRRIPEAAVDQLRAMGYLVERE